MALVDPVFSVVRSAEGKLILPAVFRERPAAISLPDTASLGGLAGSGGVLGGDGAEAGSGAEVASGTKEESVEEEKDVGDPGKEEGVDAGRDGAAKTAAVKDEDASMPQRKGRDDGEERGVTDDETSGAAGEGDEGKPRERSPLVIRHGARDYFFGDFVIEQGTIQVLSFDDRPLLEVRDVELSVGMGGFPPEGGEFSAAAAILFGEIEVENLRSPIVTDGIVVGLPRFECDFRGGKVEGRVEASLLATGLPFLVGLQFSEIPMQMASELFGGRVTFSEGAMGGAGADAGVIAGAGDVSREGRGSGIGCATGKESVAGPDRAGSGGEVFAGV